jgi:RNA-directed DNA polymerase
MDANRKSDESVVPATSANNGATGASAESAEERDSTKRNAQKDALCRTQCRKQHKSGGLHGVREAARTGSQLKLRMSRTWRPTSLISTIEFAPDSR